MKENSSDQENNFKNAEVQTDEVQFQDKEKSAETINIDKENEKEIAQSVSQEELGISFTSSLLLLLTILIISVLFISLTQK